MRSRKDILADLISLKGNVNELKNALSEFSWDVEEPVLIISKTNVAEILKRAIAKEITFKEIEDWAEAIECRDDLGFENDQLRSIIFELANSTINTQISIDFLKSLLDTVTIHTL